eukprot:scaffold26677_cov109-Isochrysis_galbana.AAC.1
MRDATHRSPCPLCLCFAPSPSSAPRIHSHSDSVLSRALALTMGGVVSETYAGRVTPLTAASIMSSTPSFDQYFASNRCTGGTP